MINLRSREFFVSVRHIF